MARKNAKKSWNPMSVSKALSPEYLTPIADALWNVQHKVSEHVEPDEGDDNWVAGCTAYKRRCKALTKLADGPARVWLWAGYIGGQFFIKILGFPIRVYRTPEEGEVPFNYTDGSTSEMELLGTVFEVENGETPAFLYRIEVVSAKLGRPFKVSLVEVNERGDVNNTYLIPRSVASVIRQAKPDDVQVRPLVRRQPPVVPPETNVESTKKKDENEGTGESAT